MACGRPPLTYPSLTSEPSRSLSPVTGNIKMFRVPPGVRTLTSHVIRFSDVRGVGREEEVVRDSTVCNGNKLHME